MLLRLTSCLFIALCFIHSASAATLSLAGLEGFLHANGNLTPLAAFSSAEPGFTSSLDGDNFGEFQFTWTNKGFALTNVTFTIFLDLDVDRDTNTYFNEYGAFVSNALPSLAPLAAIAFSAWEIDEPEYTFGNIYSHSLAGTLDNTNALPASGIPDDVSHALQFSIGTLNTDQTLRVAGRLSPTDAAGLAHIDPDSPFTVYFNGYALVEGGVAEIPEPSAVFLHATAGLLWLAASRARKAHSR